MTTPPAEVAAQPPTPQELRPEEAELPNASEAYREDRERFEAVSVCETLEALFVEALLMASVVKAETALRARDSMAFQIFGIRSSQKQMPARSQHPG